jgi:hypothetical protein
MLLKQRNTRFNWKYLAAFFVFLLTLFIFGTYSNYNLKTNGKFSTAHIIKIIYGAKANEYFKYEFKTSEGEEIIDIDLIHNLEVNNIFVGKSFLVIYDPDCPTDNRVITTPDIYEEYGLVFPDSLQWILKYTN